MVSKPEGDLFEDGEGEGEIGCESGWRWKNLRTERDGNYVETWGSLITQFLGQLDFSLFSTEEMP
jgi:hypothetical protein